VDLFIYLTLDFGDEWPILPVSAFPTYIKLASIILIKDGSFATGTDRKPAIKLNRAWSDLNFNISSSRSVIEVEGCEP